MEVSYFPLGGSITDYTCEMFANTVAVSVTRAMKYRGDYCLEDAQLLLQKKLKGRPNRIVKHVFILTPIFVQHDFDNYSMGQSGLD